MNLSLVLFVLGILFIVIGYTNQISPHCNQDIKVRVIPRQVYDEILSYDHDLLTFGMDRINRACNNIKDFDVANYEKHIEEIHKKIQHNQRLLTNTNSSLWIKLRQTMETNIGKYYDY